MERKVSILIILILILSFIIPLNRVLASDKWKIIKVLDEGIYEIETKLDSNKVLDISAASKDDKANVQIWERSNVLQQRFQITYTNGFYTIKNINSGKVLDVAYAKQENGTNVWQHENNLSDAQKWSIFETEDGYYTFISKCNDLALTITDSRTHNGTNIEVNKDKGLEAQKFILKKVTTPKGTKTIEDGVYTIGTALDSKKVLDISAASTASRANVQIWDNVNVAQQKFVVKYDNGYYSIKNLNSGKMIDVANGEIAKGTNVWQYASNSTDAQKWIITETDDGYYNIISKSSGIYLDVAGGNTANGTNVQINIKTDTAKQKFSFNKVQDDSNGIIKNGTYEITAKTASNMILDISGGSTLDGANVQIWADTNEKQQKFEFTYLGSGLYKIISSKSNKALTVDKSGTSYSSNVYQSTYNEGANQLWRIEESVTKGYYYIISAYNERNLDITGGEMSNGTNIRVYNSNQSNSQQFAIEQRSYGIDVSHWQNEIDFKTLSNSKKIDFMIIRAGQGTTIKDRQFERNYTEAKKYNIPIGAYLYAKAQSVEDARNEANYLVSLLKGKKFELPIFYDIEEHENLDNSIILQMFTEYYNILKKAGYKPGLYASKYYLMYKIDVNKLPSDTGIWVASYGKNNGSVPIDAYKFFGKFDIWQYTSTGTVPGIVGNVDCNISY